MRKFVLTLAALAAVGFVMPTMSAKADDKDDKVVIKDRGEHRDRDRDHHKVVIVKHGHHHDHDHDHD
ncbi:MAG TPA: hypothetical protein VGH49_13075 [Xanthobacteraceae bacterium]|jgi:Ni/Co efflux regulator RcnB